MLVLGIDPGTATTGYGLVRGRSDGSLEAIDYGVILTSSELPMAERLKELFSRIEQILVLHHPQSGAVEKLFFQRNVSTALSVGQARGVALLAMSRQGLDIAEYTPLEVKLAVAGFGRAEKKQIQQMVKALLDLKQIPTPDDAADALAVAICHVHSARIKRLILEQS